MQPSYRWPVLVIALLAVVLVNCGDGGDEGSRFTDRLVLNRPNGLVERDLATGDDRLLIPPPDNNILTEPAVSPDGMQIAYVGLLGAVVIPGQPTDLGSDLYVAAADGSNPRMVAEHAVRGEQLHSPAWLPDGDLLIHAQRFENQQIVVDIERIDVTSGERTVVLTNGFAPGSAPDGSRFTFIRPEPDLTVSLWMANIDGSNEQRLLPDSGLVSFNDPRFSPDGRYIAVGATAPGEQLLAPSTRAALVSLDASNVTSDSTNGLPEDIWLIDTQTMEATRLADLDLDQPSVTWSSDSQRLFAMGDRGLYYIDLQGNGEEHVGEGMYHGQVSWLSAQ